MPHKCQLVEEVNIYDVILLIQIHFFCGKPVYNRPLCFNVRKANATPMTPKREPIALSNCAGERREKIKEKKRKEDVKKKNKSKSEINIFFVKYRLLHGS